MAFNSKRTARMATKSVAELLRIYEAKTLASAAAGHELARRGVQLPRRD